MGLWGILSSGSLGNNHVGLDRLSMTSSDGWTARNWSVKPTRATSLLDGHDMKNRNQRSLVERRFRRMNQDHDRIRTALLAAHSQDTRQK